MKRYVPSLLVPLILAALAVLSSLTPARAALLFDRGDATWRWRPGTNEASAPIEAWRDVGFIDTQFTTAPTPFWFTDVLPGGTQIMGMSNVYTCIFLRKTFVVTNPTEVAGLRLGALVDDGFVAWINGIEVQRVNNTNPPGTAILFNDLVVNAVEPVAFTIYNLTSPPNYLVMGTNVLAVQVAQSSMTSSDFGFDASLEAILAETNPPTVLSVSPAPLATVGALTSVTVTFSEPVMGVDAFDLRANGVAATSVTPINSSTYAFGFIQPAYGTVTISFDPTHGIADQAIPPNPFDHTGATATWTYTLVDNTAPVIADLMPSAGATVRTLASITVVFSEGVSGVDAADLRINMVAAAGLIPDAPNVYRFTFPEPMPGLVSVQWDGGHGIKDLSPAMNPFVPFNWLYTLDPNAAEGSTVIISEFMAANSGGLPDPEELGVFPDWIEIQNIGTSTANLDGWYLTDNLGNLTKWRFPATNLNAGAFLIVYATPDKDRRVPGMPLYTGFGLTASGEQLALVMPDGVTIASQYPPTMPPSQFPQQVPNVSYGLGVVTTNQTLIDSNATLRVRIPADGAEGLGWTTNGYIDSAWTLGTNGVGFGTTNVTQADYGASVLLTAPLAYYRLNETTGTTATNIGSGAGLNATYNTVTLGAAGPRPPLLNGFEPDNNAATFAGSGFVSGPAGLLNSRAAFSMAGWIRPTAAQAARTGLFGQNDLAEFGFISAGNIQFWTFVGSIDFAYPFANNEWHHIAAIATGTQLQLYMDGTLRATAPMSGPTTTSGFNFNIGGGGIFDGAANFFNGQLDEVGAWGRALSGAEILQLYQSGTNVFGFSVVPYVKTHVGPAMSNVNATAQIRIPFNVANPSNVSSLTLRMRYDDGFAAFVNGVEVARANAPASLDFNSAAPAAHAAFSVESFTFSPLTLVAGPNILALQGLNRTHNDEDFLVVAEMLSTGIAAEGDAPLYFTVPTPGAVNNVGTMAPGPAIVETDYGPTIPQLDDDIVVTARVAPTFGSVSSVLLRYRLMFDAEIEVPMLDNGLSGDGAPNDGLYGATIPASLSTTNGQMIRWSFRAIDSLGRTSRWPFFNDPANTAEYEGTVVSPHYVTSKIPVVHLFAPATVLQPGPTTGQTGADSQGGGRVSVYYDGELYDNIQMALRGNTTAGYNKKSHRLEFNREHPFRSPGPGPRLTKTSFVADYPDPAYMRQGLAFWLCDQLGSPSSFYHPVRLQRNGSFYQLANHNDVHGDEMLDRLGFDPRGALYNAAGNAVASQNSTGGFEKKTREHENNADYQALVAGIAETNSVAARHTNIFDNFDVPNAINYLVAARWSHENDDVWANLSLYHDNDGDNLWRIIAFDMNLSWGAIFYEGGNALVIEGVQATNDIHKAHPLYGSSQALALSGPGAPNNYNRVYDAFFLVPRIREMFLRRMRTMLDTFIMPPGTPPNTSPAEQYVLCWRDLVLEEANRDRAFWGWPAKGGQCNFDPGISFTNGVNALLQGFIQTRRNHFYLKHTVANTGLAVGITKADNAGIPLAQPAAAVIQVAGVEANPSGGNQQHEYVCVTNSMPYAVDISDWELSGGVRFTFQKGTVMPSNSVLYVSPNVRAFKARLASPRGGEGHFVVGPYEGQLSARGESLFIHDTTGRLVNSNGYAGSPSLAQQYLRVSELMYNPSPAAGLPNDAQDFEYAELRNISMTETLNLNGVRFSNGIAFSFTGSAVTSLGPGQTVLVVKSNAAFAARYPGMFTIAGQYTGNLDSGGERVTLVDTNNEEILDFTYNNTWYPITDGQGFSLVAADLNQEPDQWNRKEGWRPSGTLNGSPGAADAPGVFAPVIITEVLTHTDMPAVDSIEIHNPSGVMADVGGWFLSDDFNTPKKYRLTNGTMIAPGGFLVFDEDDFNPGGTSFALSSDGDEVWLFSGDAQTNLTGYVHGYEFGAAANGVSFGRYVNSQTNVHFVAQAVNTLMATNGAPRVGPVAISEIMFHPPDAPDTNEPCGFPDFKFPVNLVADNSTDEFIELCNITGTNVPFYDPAAATNTWRLRGGVDFDFPTNVTLTNGAYLLLVNFNPADAALTAAFRARYSVPAHVPLHGPYEGKLDNSSDRITLSRPDAPNTNGVPYVRIDSVEYEDDAPWPSGADGTGASLQRLDTAEYGDDPINWGTGSPTPGSPRGSGTPPVITMQPANTLAVASGMATLSVMATGTEPRRYQWYFNGTVIPGATASTYTLMNVGPVQAGAYHAVVHNAVGVAVSSNATVSIAFPALIVSNPTNVIVRIKPDPQAAPTTNATFRALGSSASALRYQWRFNGTNIDYATNTSHTVTNVQLINEGLYDCLMTDDVGTIASSAALLTAWITPSVTDGAIISHLVITGAQVTFGVTYAGHPLPFRYEWRAGSTPFLIRTSNLRSDFITWTATNRLETNKLFRTVVNNVANPAPAAAGATISTNLLTTANDLDSDGMPDTWESAFNVSDPNGDPDGDRMKNLDEYLAGTDPNNGNSFLKIELVSAGVGGATVRVGCASNHTHTVQYTDQLPLSWQRLGDVAPRRTNFVVEIADPAYSPNRVYRAVTPKQ